MPWLEESSLSSSSPTKPCTTKSSSFTQKSITTVSDTRLFSTFNIKAFKNPKGVWIDLILKCNKYTLQSINLDTANGRYKPMVLKDQTFDVFEFILHFTFEGHVFVLIYVKILLVYWWWRLEVFGESLFCQCAVIEFFLYLLSVSVFVLCKFLHLLGVSMNKWNNVWGRPHAFWEYLCCLAQHCPFLLLTAPIHLQGQYSVLIAAIKPKR